MTELKATKGEWSIYGDWGIKANGRVIAGLSPENREGPAAYEEDQANLELMVASKRMAEALIALLEQATPEDKIQLENEFKLCEEALNYALGR